MKHVSLIVDGNSTSKTLVRLEFVERFFECLLQRKTTDNHHFGNVEETGILVSVADIYPEKKERHISSFTNSQTV